MLTFLTTADVNSANLPPPVRNSVQQALTNLFSAYSTDAHTYSPEDDGYVVLVEAKDTEETILTVLGHLPAHLPWDGGYRDGETLVGVLLRNNQFGLTVVVPPDANAVLRRHLIEALDDPRRKL